MRADSRSISSNPVNPYNAASEKASGARRSFQTRRKAVKQAAAVRAWTGADKAPVIGQWMNGGRGKTVSKDQRRGSVIARLPEVA